MITPNSEASAEHMYKAGRLACATLDAVEEHLRINPYCTTKEIDKLAEEFIRSNGGVPECIGYAPRGYPPYPCATCTSVNDVACHGIPDDYRLRDGDIINVDLVVNYNGWLGDTSRTFTIGNVSEEDLRLVQIAKNAMYIGMAQVKLGQQFRYIGIAIEEYCNKEGGVSILRDYVGHGIGRRMHQKPMVEHTRNECRDLMMPYIYFTVEPIIATGNSISTQVMDDKWCVKMKNGARAAQFEHTIGLDKYGKLMIFTSRDQDHEEKILKEIIEISNNI